MSTQGEEQMASATNLAQNPGDKKQPVLALQEVTKTYSLGRQSTVEAVRGISLSVAEGEFVMITGRSGSGKTTLLNLMAGLTRPTSGSVLFNGEDLWGLSDRQRSTHRNQRVGFIFQFPSLIGSLTAIENILLPTMFAPRDRRLDGGPARQRAEELLGIVGLSDKLAARPRQLSAGQQKRTVIARALMNEPSLLLADEPTADLDERTEQEIVAFLCEVQKTRNLTIVMVTHAGELLRVATRALEMSEGTLSERIHS